MIIVIAVAGGVYYLNPFASNADGFVIVNTYPHDPKAFTQGLVMYDGNLLEGTGLYGRSSLRWVDLESGEVLNSVELSPEYFGEGITVLDGKIYQLTWREETGYVYDLDSFTLLDEFSYSGEGWGLTTDDDALILSNGSAVLQFLDPDSYQITKTLEVKYESQLLDNLNELEYVNGLIYANIWRTDQIALIDANSGVVLKLLDLSSLRKGLNSGDIDVLNGIAYNPDSGHFFLTGKLWPTLFEVRFRD